MDAISVEHDELNIQTTIVLLKAMKSEGAIGLPLAVELAAANPEEGWRRVAIQYLDEMESRKQKGLPLRKPRKVDNGKWAELNERWDYEEKRERSA